MRSRIIIVLVGSLTAGAASPALGQQGDITLIGSVVDTAGGPLDGVQIAVEGTDVALQTGSDGSFRFSLLRGGEYFISFEKDGWISRRFRLTVRGDQQTQRDLGRVTLQVLPSNSLVLTGHIRDEVTGAPLSSVAVEVNRRTIAITDSTGAFRNVVAVEPTGNRVVLRRIGYETQQYLFDRPEGETEVDFEVRLTSAPIPLSDIFVEATPLASRRLAGFNRRRELGLGQFFTAEEIEEMQPVVTSDVIRRVPGVTVRQASTPSEIGVAPQDLGRPPPGTTTKILFYGRRTRRAGEPLCEPTMFVDGIRLSSPNLDVLTQPERLAGIEVYQSAANIPPEYTTAGRECGVIVLWTKDGMFDTRTPVAVGAHYGGSFAGGRFSRGRIGGQLVMRFLGGLDLNPGFSVIIDVPSASNSSSFSGWQLLLNVRKRPLGERSPWYVGGGLTVVSMREKFDADPLDLTRGRTPANLFPMVLTGLAARIGELRPFVEFHLVDVLHPRSVEGMFYSGIRVAVGSN